MLHRSSIEIAIKQVKRKGGSSGIDKMQEIATGEGRTVLFVSHNMAAMRSLCNTGVLIENGTIINTGEINSIIAAYRKSVQDVQHSFEIDRGVFDLSKAGGNQQKNNVIMQKVTTFCDNEISNDFYGGCNFRFDVEILNDQDYKNAMLGFVIKDMNEQPLIGINNRHTGDFFEIQKNKISTLKIEVPKLPIYKEGTYTVDLYLGNFNTDNEILHNAFSFNIFKTDVFKSSNLLDNHINLIYVEKVHFSVS